MVNQSQNLGIVYLEPSLPPPPKKTAGILEIPSKKSRRIFFQKNGSLAILLYKLVRNKKFKLNEPNLMKYFNLIKCLNLTNNQNLTWQLF